MELNTRALTSTEKSTVMENLLGLMDQSIMAIFLTIIFMEEGFTLGLMEGNTMVNGKIIKWTDRGHFNGQMGESKFLNLI